jgi:hypothetical protein
MTLTLWDLIEPIRRRLRPEKVVVPPRKPPPPTALIPPASGPRVPIPVARPARRKPAAGSSTITRANSKAKPADAMQAKYDAVVKLMLDRYQIRVRKWRTSMSGIAWYVTYRDGHVQRLIEAPRPKGPMSAAVFLHEIGHHAIGFDVYKPRCLEEYHAWRWALEAMEAQGLNITDAVRDRMYRSLWYALEKAKRRGIKVIPPELCAYTQRRPPRRRRAR